ncbi:MAG: hypothetical protein EB141_20945, partial [Verrucomicrobia bacterium]|nr:hypothetical protein [Verrucomicrobiota bacterium]
HTDYDFFPAELAEKYQADDQRVMTAGKVFEAVEEHTPPGGEKEYVQVVKSPVFDAQGKIIGTQGIFWDVTARVRGEEKLKKAHTDLARSREDLLRTLADLQRSHSRFKEAQQQMVEMEKMQTVGQMAAGIAHEVKNPLAVIRMGMDYLTNAIDTAGNEAVGTVLKDMQDALHRADGIIMGLLDFRQGAQQIFPAAGQVGVSFLQLFLAPHARGHVPEDALGADDLALRIEHRGFHHLHVFLFAAWRGVLLDGFKHLPGGHHPLVVRLVLGGQLGGEEVIVGVPDDFLERPAQFHTETAVREGEMPLGILAVDVLRQALDE